MLKLGEVRLCRNLTRSSLIITRKYTKFSNNGSSRTQCPVVFGQAGFLTLERHRKNPDAMPQTSYFNQIITKISPVLHYLVVHWAHLKTKKKSDSDNSSSGPGTCA